MQKWAPWAMTPSRKAWPWTRLPMSRPCMSVIATTIVSICPSRTISSSSSEAVVPRRVVVLSVSLMVGLRIVRRGMRRAGRASAAGPRIVAGGMRSGGLGSPSSSAACSNSRSISVSSASAPIDLRALEARPGPAEVVDTSRSTTIPTMNGHEMLPEVGNENRTIRTSDPEDRDTRRRASTSGRGSRRALRSSPVVVAPR